MEKVKDKTCGNCPIAQTSALMGDIWVILIVRDLLGGARRFGELQASLTAPESGAHINSRTLTARLKMLEDMGIINRKAYEHEKPPRVEYTLTAKGKDLSSVIDTLKAFGNKHLIS